MTPKRRTLLGELGMGYNEWSHNYIWQLNLKTQLSDIMLEQIEDSRLPIMLGSYLEKMRFEMFEFIAKQQKLINDYE